ncbi:hypothetical protein BN946_scf185001.g64 [Trametes cinnabarina]|uniref:DUF6534 domain-containing protein n=1 Tax=Pycnoporus cinnabarinus TaxID=5643 RepID=A0A060SKZ1_PYCCI|nr:hypothetical protein BN946_scf185001.g64 [Trametes cinnabarina]
MAVLGHQLAVNGTNVQTGISPLNHSPPPVLLGGLVALFLSGAVFMQVALYFQVYQTDRQRIKTLVLIVWLLDLTHSAMVCTANWENLVVHYGDVAALDSIAWSIAVTIALTVTLALLRVSAASVTTAEMIRIGNYPQFVAEFDWVFTLGLAVSSFLDVLITSIMCYYIRKGRTAFVRMNRIIDVLTLYTVENGMITCIATSLSLFFWLFMRSNFAFLGMHLAINKLYANSFLASLNARKAIANKSQGSGQGHQGDGFAMPVMFPNSHGTSREHRRYDGLSTTGPKTVEITIDVEQTVQRDLDEHGHPPSSDIEGDMSTNMEKQWGGIAH